jgi:hypothetical protein
VLLARSHAVAVLRLPSMLINNKGEGEEEEEEEGSDSRNNTSSTTTNSSSSGNKNRLLQLFKGTRASDEMYVFCKNPLGVYTLFCSFILCFVACFLLLLVCVISFSIYLICW